MPAPRTAPDLTPLQRQRVADVLTRVGRVPLGSITALFIDVDRAASRAVNPSRPSYEDCRIVAVELASAHHIDPATVAFTFGVAIGVRMGRTFAPPPTPRTKWISDEYKRLHEGNRRDVQRYIRKLLKAQEPPRPPAASPQEELAAARRWMQQAGKAARQLR